MFPVDIEVEHIYSATSEEDSATDLANPHTSSTKKKSVVSIGAATNQGSVGDLPQSHAVGPKKKRDHLK